MVCLMEQLLGTQLFSALEVEGKVWRQVPQDRTIEDDRQSLTQAEGGALTGREGAMGQEHRAEPFSWETILSAHLRHAINTDYFKSMVLEALKKQSCGLHGFITNRWY